MEQKYYFITVFNSYDEFGPHSLRCWAFYNDWDDADYTLSNNMTDLWETCYNYGVIEEYHTGLFGYNFKRWFYKYNKETGFYNKINEPKELEHYVGFALG